MCLLLVPCISQWLLAALQRESCHADQPRYHSTAPHSTNSTRSRANRHHTQPHVRHSSHSSVKPTQHFQYASPTSALGFAVIHIYTTGSLCSSRPNVCPLYSPLLVTQSLHSDHVEDSPPPPCPPTEQGAKGRVDTSRGCWSITLCRPWQCQLVPGAPSLALRRTVCLVNSFSLLHTSALS